MQTKTTTQFIPEHNKNVQNMYYIIFTKSGDDTAQSDKRFVDVGTLF